MSDPYRTPPPPQPNNDVFIRLHTIFLSEREKREGWRVERVGRSLAKVLRDEKLKRIITAW
ncbi:hypothetical protein HZC53_04315 [Candidatus Uhrbacteria bacterium]|nr:hypothetical protein [Candidatus Uhrbacteria bacterium]